MDGLANINPMDDDSPVDLLVRWRFLRHQAARLLHYYETIEGLEAQLMRLETGAGPHAGWMLSPWLPFNILDHMAYRREYLVGLGNAIIAHFQSKIIKSEERIDDMREEVYLSVGTGNEALADHHLHQALARRRRLQRALAQIQARLAAPENYNI